MTTTAHNEFVDGVTYTDSFVARTADGTPQTVTVTGVDDSLTDGDIAYSVVIGAATSTDALYNGKDPADIALTNTDDDTAGITVSAPSAIPAIA